MARQATDDRQETLRDFREAVNMTASQLDKWLKTEESRAVGQKDSEGDESTGHASGRRIVALLNKAEGEYDDDDLAHMRKVVGYVHRHSAQRPEGGIEETPWRYSLMNWGHDPMSESGS